MPERYRTPPLVEAIYEVYFPATPGWSDLAYKRLEQRLGARFNGRRDDLQAVGFEFEFKPGVTPAGRPAPAQPRQRRLWAADGGELFQFSPLMCAYNVLSRYQKFDLHADDIEQLYAVYLAEAQPEATEFVGQRYINRVVLPAGMSDPSAFFEVYPTLPGAILHRPFALQVVTGRFDDGEVALNLAFQGEQDGSPVFFLDIYARSTRPIPSAAHDLRMWHERAHPHVRASFESALKAKARELFGPPETR